MKPSSPALRILREGDGRMVVVVDFPGIRSAAGFDPFVASAPSDELVVGPLVTAELDANAEVLARTQVAAWVDELEGLGRPVAGVLGYCAGSPLALRLAHEMHNRTGETIPVTVVDPSWVDHDTIVSEYREARSSLLRDHPDLTGAHAKVVDASSGDVVEMARGMCNEYAAAASEVAQAMDLPPDLMADLVRRLDRYLAYLVVASAATTAMVSCPSPELTLLSGQQTPQKSRTAQRILRFDEPRTTLMARADVLDVLWASVLVCDEVEPPRNQ